MITKEKRSEMVRYWWAKAEESLASARREFQAGSMSFAMNRLYYAKFYAVSALLMTRDLSFKKHSGVRAASTYGCLEVVKYLVSHAAIISPDFIQFYNH